MQLVRAIARAIGIAIALGLAILASAAPASAAEKKDYGPKVDRVSLSDWYEVRGPGFSLFARGDKKRVVSAGKRLLSFIEVVQATTNIHKLEPRAPIRIFMLEMLDYYRFGPRGSGGVAFTETAPWQLVVNRDVGSSRETLLHEYTHFLTTNHGQAYPRWFEEGFAELLSTLRFKEDLAYVGAPPGGRLAVVQREGGLPLRAILGAREYPDMIQWFYAPPMPSAIRANSNRCSATSHCCIRTHRGRPRSTAPSSRTSTSSRNSSSSTELGCESRTRPSR